MGQWIVLSWNTIDDVGLVMDTQSCEEGKPMAAMFDTEEEAEAYAQSVCAWSYKLVHLGVQVG